MKTALVTYKKTISLKNINDFKRKLSYDKFFILTQNINFEKDELKKEKRFIVIECPYKDILEKISQIFKKYQKEYKILPFFSGDKNSKFAIRVYNKLFNLKIDPRSFRLKSHMNEYLGGELGCKKTLNFSYEELQSVKYQKLKKELGTSFILKPVNGASSILNFKISSNKELINAKQKLQKKYKYVVEEYLEGNLYSLDFYSDGKDIFLLCFAREIPFMELISKLSPEYMQKYQQYLKSEFLHFLPIRYTLDLKKLSSLEINFVKKIGERLKERKYHGFIHLEYKTKRKEGKIGFIEWGARLGGKRAEFVTGMHGLRLENLPLEIIHRHDTSRFEKRKGLYFLKNRDIDKNFLMIYTNVLKKTNIIDVLAKIPSYLNTSFEDFLKSYLWDNWRIKVKRVTFFLSTNSEGNIFPFYERSDTKLNYIMEFEEDSFKLFLKKKHRILEHLVFHDYKK